MVTVDYSSGYLILNEKFKAMDLVSLSRIPLHYLEMMCSPLAFEKNETSNLTEFSASVQLSILRTDTLISLSFLKLMIF
jgi:hypothetical protein